MPVMSLEMSRVFSCSAANQQPTMGLFHRNYFDIVRKTQMLFITLTIASFYSNVSLSHDSVTMSHHAQYQEPKTEADKCSSAVHFIIYSCVFPTVTCDNVFIKMAYRNAVTHVK